MNCVVYGVRGYRGCEGVIVCDSREMRAKRQVVEGVISQIKLFNAGRILYEFSGVPEEVAEEAHRLVDAKLPIKTRLVKAGGIKT